MNGDRRSALRCVADASTGIKLFIAEELADRADALFGLLAADPPAEIWVPDLFYIECANILWKYVRRFGHSPDQAQRDLADLAALTLRSVPTADLIEKALDLGLAHGITAYDASYVALSDRLAIPLITADERLVRVLAGTGYTVEWLGDFNT
jgi:predicted nucleic acid-binding protein